MTQDNIGLPTDIATVDVTPTMREPDGVHCRFCGADSGDAAPGSSEYRAFWETHEARGHKIAQIRTKVGARPANEILAAILAELL